MSTETEENRLAVADSVVTAITKADKLGLALARPFSRRILVLETPVAGIFHVKGIHRLIRKLKKGDPIVLVREPKNAYDRLAVLVRNAEGKKLGYIPRAKNEVLANLMDAGKCFEAEVHRTKDEKDSDRTMFEATQIWIRVYMVE